MTPVQLTQIAFAVAVGVSALSGLFFYLLRPGSRLANFLDAIDPGEDR